MSAAALCRTPPLAVPLPKIPDALRGLWSQCSSSNGGGEVARSLAINLVGLADAGDEAALRDAVARLQARTPCRAFLLLTDPRATKPVAEVAATTRTHGGLHDIVLEEIVVRVPEAGLDQVPGLVRPLLVNDLPNHLYWASPWPRLERHFDDLAGLCDHAVVDTRLFRAPARELGHLAARRGSGRRLTDLTWLRLRPWRRALAEAFERVPWRAAPGSAVTIRHGGAATASALLLGQWLEARLSARVAFDATDAADSVCPAAIDLRSSGCEVEARAEGNHVTVHVTTADSCYLPFKVPISRGRDGDLLAAAIDHG